jgi:hypothetical protein
LKTVVVPLAGARISVPVPWKAEGLKLLTSGMPPGKPAVGDRVTPPLVTVPVTVRAAEVFT